MSFATIASMFASAWPHCADRKTAPESTAAQPDASDRPDDGLLRSQMELTWSLAKLALELKLDQGARASNEVAQAVRAAPEKADRYSRQTSKNGLALTHLNSLKQAIAGLGLDVYSCATVESGGRFDAAKGVTQ